MGYANYTYIAVVQKNYISNKRELYGSSYNF